MRQVYEGRQLGEKLAVCPSSVERWVNQIRKHLSGQALSRSNRSTKDRRHRYTFVLMTVRRIPRFTVRRVCSPGWPRSFTCSPAAILLLKAARGITITHYGISGALAPFDTHSTLSSASFPTRVNLPPRSSTIYYRCVLLRRDSS